MLQDIQNVEEYFNIKFNKKYINILEEPSIALKYIEKQIDFYDPEENKQCITSISTFLYPKRSSSNSILLNPEKFYAPDELINNKIIPFGMDAGGWLFCFDYRNNREFPSIVLFIRDNSEGKDITDLAISFEEFLGKLKSEEN